MNHNIRNLNRFISGIIIHFLIIFFQPLKVDGQSGVFFNITPHDGLPVTSITDITQDAAGFIWVGTWDGVFRYDGKHFAKMFHNGRYLAADDDGGIWVAVQTGTIIYYDIYTEETKVFNNIDSRRHINIEIDATQKVWLGTDRGLMQYNNEKDTFLLVPGVPEGNVFNPKSSKAGTLSFVIQVDGQYFLAWFEPDGQLDMEPFSSSTLNKNGFVYSYPYAFQSLQDGSTIMVNEHGIWKKPTKQSDWEKIQIDNIEALTYPDSYLIQNNQLWINRQDAISKVDLNTGATTTYNSNYKNRNSILPMESHRHGSNLFIDRQNVLWIPRFSYGISRVNLFGNDFGLIHDENNEIITDVLSAIELDDGTYYIGSREFGPSIYHFDSDGTIINRFGNHMVSSDYPPGKSTGRLLSHPYPWALKQTTDGNIWIGTGSPGAENGGLNKMNSDGNEITVFRHDPEDNASIYSNWISSLHEDKHKRLWVNSRDGLSWIDLETEVVSRIYLSHIQDDDPDFSFVTLTSNDKLLAVNDYDATVYVIDLSNLEIEKTDLKLPDVSTGWNVYLHDDGNGKIWFNSEKGFGYTDYNFDEVIKFWKFEEISFPASQIIGIISEENGDLWFSTDNGLVEFKSKTNELKHFGIDRGLQGNLFETRLNYRGPSGKFYFAGNGGVNVFNPKTIVKNPSPPLMLITSVLLDNVPISDYDIDTTSQAVFNRKKISVGPEVSTLNIEFNAIHFASSGENNYQYKLEGYDNNWTSGRGLGTATYTNLPHGRYTFLVKGSNLDGMWSDVHKLDVTIFPPWWKTWWAYLLYGIVFILIFRRAHQYQKEKTIRLEREKIKDRELAQAREIEKAYTDLKATQSQLIQSEKMASLGELTAGIAHEIQNPLNFVNNFSEVSGEMIDEVNEEIEGGDMDEAKEILQDLKGNLEKINYHGQRASGIVKSMLDHSRTTSGEKVATDINALCDEYLRLAYHGMRAKDRTFNAEFEIDLDESIPKINVISQDFGRVLLNLINNAFQATHAKSKLVGMEYQPLVKISSKKTKEGVHITVLDNGPGIPADIMDKVFQPFFTTKPAGQGTGLGLSLSYDIIKAHGGELKVESKEGEGSEFIIKLPIKEK